MENARKLSKAVDESESQVDANCGRDPVSGKFIKGNGFGRGNPFGRITALLRSALIDAVSPEEMAEIVKTLIGKAKKGDVAAANIIFDRAIGKPVEAANPDRLDIDELEIIIDKNIADLRLALPVPLTINELAKRTY